MYKTSYQAESKTFISKLNCKRLLLSQKRNGQLKGKKTYFIYVLYKSKRKESILSKTESANSSHSLHLECSTSLNVLIHLH